MRLKKLLAVIAALITTVACICFTASCDDDNISSGDSFTVIFNPNYEDAENVEIIVKENEQVEAPDISHNGYELRGWYIDQACMEDYDFTTTVTNDFMLYASWRDSSKTYYTVTLNGNYEGAVNSTQTIVAGNVAPIPEAPVRDCYIFIGWYLDEECTVNASFQVAIEEDVTYYAVGMLLMETISPRQ